MKKISIIGISSGVILGIMTLILLSFSDSDYSPNNFESDPSSIQFNSYYDEISNRLQIILYFYDDNGDPIKATGSIRLFVERVGDSVYENPETYNEALLKMWKSIEEEQKQAVQGTYVPDKFLDKTVMISKDNYITQKTDYGKEYLLQYFHDVALPEGKYIIKAQINSGNSYFEPIDSLTVFR